jgi:hypothetical protein
MYRLFLFFLYLQKVFLFSIPNHIPKTRVNLHLEKFNEKYNLLHIGICFENNFEKIRYDYRAFCDEQQGCTYETTNIDRLNPREVFPNTDLLDNLEISEDIKKVKIYWGDTDKTFEEIREFEKTLHCKYILGVNDCRHYVNRFTKWALNKPTPIWKLNRLWDKYYKITTYDIDEN